MPKLPFTEAAMGQKVQDLKALPDAQLATNAKLIASDFRGWLVDTFDLSAQQTQYINLIPDLIIDHWGYGFASALACRGDVGIPKPKDYGPPTRPKEVKAKYSGSSEYKPLATGGYQFDTDFKVVFEFIYP